MQQLLFLMLLVFAVTGCDQVGGGKVSLKTDKQKVSYAIGQQIGQGMKSQNVEVDEKVLFASIKHALQGKESQMTDEEMRAAIRKMNENMMKARIEEGKKNKEEGEKFLAENKAKPDVKTTESGLQYTVIKAGTGKQPSDTDTVKVHYKGTLLNGEEFDSSYKRREPAKFPVGGVIKGWTEALKMMKEGGKWKLYIPSDLAYGPMGRPSIPPNSVLVFEVELLEVVAKDDSGDKKAAKGKKSS